MAVKNKRILITGATSGIGREAAIALAKQGAHVIIHGRDAAKAAAVKQEIGVIAPDAAVDVLLADLLKKSDVLALAEAFNSRFDSLDVLINNAGGVMNTRREETEDGWEKTIALNVLAPFMLSALLYPKLQRQPDARIINTASMAHYTARPDLNDLMYEQRYHALRAYGDAKLFVILMGREFASRQRNNPQDNQVIMNAFHPGMVATNFAGQSDSLYHLFFRFFRPLLTSPKKGADTMVYLATDEKKANNFNGAYFVKRKRAKIYIPKRNAELTGALWAAWERYTGIPFL
ncbi:SDR family NAD(P)-dependent oxidoreductase [Parapedobacter lycopersici]|uniref:SDR family NAD(P)-dependent oxidoreductase n=1 Tax=Parapedobacter lycopersici TaxID=1864939 RepID=UPI00214DDC1F|nr:SDR family NAD(P)-dependent oxidoreductase [Parapedobacter lycopersici]